MDNCVYLNHSKLFGADWRWSSCCVSLLSMVQELHSFVLKPPSTPASQQLTSLVEDHTDLASKAALIRLKAMLYRASGAVFTALQSFLSSLEPQLCPKSYHLLLWSDFTRQAELPQICAWWALKIHLMLQAKASEPQLDAWAASWGSLKMDWQIFLAHSMTAIWGKKGAGNAPSLFCLFNHFFLLPSCSSHAWWVKTFSWGALHPHLGAGVCCAASPGMIRCLSTSQLVLLHPSPPALWQTQMSLLNQT